MASSGMLRRVALARSDVSEELSASIIRVKRIGELGTTLAVTNNRRNVYSFCVADSTKQLIYMLSIPSSLQSVIDYSNITHRTILLYKEVSEIRIPLHPKEKKSLSVGPNERR
jgi:hypothetical protein